MDKGTQWTIHGLRKTEIHGLERNGGYMDLRETVREQRYLEPMRTTNKQCVTTIMSLFFQRLRWRLHHGRQYDDYQRRRSKRVKENAFLKELKAQLHIVVPPQREHPFTSGAPRRGVLVLPKLYRNHLGGRRGGTECHKTWLFS